MTAHHRCLQCIGSAVMLAVMCGVAAPMQSDQSPPFASAQQQSNEAPNLNDKEVIETAVAQLLTMQEGEGNAEWPYEGVYRVGRNIPIGYRIGGSAICSLALINASGYKDDQLRKDAVERALKFIIATLDHPLMSPDYDGGYDVRGWGYTYALAALLKVHAIEAHPDGMNELIEASIVRLIKAIEQTEIPQIGGWNYARGQGKDVVSPPSPFMTAPTLQALFEAKRMNFTVDEAVINRAIDTLIGGKTPTGSYKYSGVNGERSRESVPGSVGRMLVTESTLHLAGRATIADVRGAIDSFFVHWQWLEKRRAQSGTHIPPYGIAPYYFFFAYYYAAQAIELLPEYERGEYRRRLHELIMSVRAPEGTWNDRVFPRSANYGTAMCILAMTAPQTEPPARWKPTQQPVE